MSSREQFLLAVESDDQSQLLALTASSTSRSTRSEAFCLSEVLNELSRKQLEEVWAKLQSTTTEILLNFESLTEEGDLKKTGAYLQSVVSIAMASVQLKDTELPRQVLQTALVLHGVLLSMPPELESLQVSIARLCEAWWSAHREDAHELTSQTFMFLLEKSLAPKATGADVKRVCGMASCLERINLEEESSSTLRNLLLHTLMSHAYLKLQTEGKRFFSYLFGLNLNFIDQLHRTIKTHIPTSNSIALTMYGEVYFQAWKTATGDFLTKIEQSCIQDLMYHAVHAGRGPKALSSQLTKVLSVLHQHKVQRGVDDMLLRLYDPIIWRSLKVANSDVRANAATLLFDTFPLQNPSASHEDNDALLQRQFDIFNTLLFDRCPSVRVVAVSGVCQVCRVFWEMIPAQTASALLQCLLCDLAWDSSSPEVRAAVVKGIMTLLDNPLIHPLLKNLLPGLKNMLHDTAEKVRVAFIDLLLKVKGMRTIKFWSIVPMEHLLARLELDGPSVARRIVQLLLNSYLPVEKPAEVQLQRCIIMLQGNQAAARTFYQHAPKHLGLEATVKLIRALSNCVYSCVKDQQEVVDSSVLADPAEEAPRDSLDDEEEEEGEMCKENAPTKSQGGGGRRSNRRKSNRKNEVPKDILDSSDDDDEEQVEEVAQEENEKDNGTEKEQQKSDSQVSTAEEDNENSGISCEDTELMAGLIDTMLILWMSSANDLGKECNKDLKRKLQRRFSHLLPVYVRAFRDERILNALILLAAFLPANAVPLISRSMVSKLKKVEESSLSGDPFSTNSKDADAGYATMLHAMCKWGKVQDVLDVVADWLETALKSTQSEANKSGRRSSKKRVGFAAAASIPRPSLALHYLHYLAANSQCRPLLLHTSARHTLTEITATLATSMVCIEQRLLSPEPLGEHCSDDFLVQAFRSYLTMEVLLSSSSQTENTDNSETTTENTTTTATNTTMNTVLTWADRELLSFLKQHSKPSGSQKRQRAKKLMRTADATLLANPSGSESFLQQTIANETLLSTSLLSQTLLDTTITMTQGGGGSGGRTGAMDVGYKVIQVILEIGANVLLVGAADEELAAQFMHFSLPLLELDSSCELVGSISTLLYHLLEWSLLHEGDGGSLAPSVLTGLIKWLAKLASNRKELATRVLPSIRGTVSEMLTSFYRHYTLMPEHMSAEVVATLVNAVTHDITMAVNQDCEFEVCDGVSTLPLLSAYILGMLTKKDTYINLFVSELSVQIAEEENTVNSRLAALHLLHALAPEKPAAGPMKDCLLNLQKQIDTNPSNNAPQSSNEETEKVKVKTSSCKDLLQKCMAATGMIAL